MYRLSPMKIMMMTNQEMVLKTILMQRRKVIKMTIIRQKFRLLIIKKYSYLLMMSKTTRKFKTKQKTIIFMQLIWPSVPKWSSLCPSKSSKN